MRLPSWGFNLRNGVLLASAALVVVMAVAIAVSAAEHLRQTVRDEATANAAAIVRGYVDTILTDESDLALDTVPDQAVQTQLEQLVISGAMRRINVWTRDGRILYTTEPALQGRRLSIDANLANAFAGTNTGDFSADPDVAGAAASRPLPSKYLRIFIPIRGNADRNPIGVFEVYTDLGTVEADVDATRRDVFLIVLGAGALLLGLLWFAFGGASRRLTLQNRRLRGLNDRLSAITGSLRDSEARFRSLVQNSSDVVAVLDANGVVSYESDAVTRVLGHDPVGRNARAFVEDVHPDDRGRFSAMIETVAATSGADGGADFRVRHADGSWRWVDGVARNLTADAAVAGLVLNYRDVTDRRRLEEELQHNAFHDGLTGLANRALFTDRVAHALARADRHPEDRLAVLFVDLDDFKVVNDSLGHAAGDELLNAVAERLRACLRRQDTAARLGGDEFAILLEDADDAGAAQIAERIIEALRQPFGIVARQIFVQASIGIALGADLLAESAGAGGASAEDLLRNADAAMYTAKSHGKGRFEFYEARMHAAAMERLELREQIEEALAAHDFAVLYQPVVSLASGELAGVEALVRWKKAGGEMAPPAEFIGLAEETGLIVPLGRWVLEESLAQLAAWRPALAGRPFSMAVNVASRQLLEPGFFDMVRRALVAAGIAPGELILELTESALLDDGEDTTSAIERLTGLGVRIGLDDFGTGYSSLSHLRRFPIDVLKIDRSFVDGIDGPDSDERALVRSIVRLARSLHLETVAEGIERPEQLVRLRALEAEYGQGYLFARPLPAGEITELLQRDARLAG